MLTPRRVVLFILLSAFTAIPLFSQGDRGLITGSIMDASGAVMPDVQILVTQKTTNALFKTATNTAGAYTVPSLPVGEYQVKAEKTGFKTSITDKVVVAAGDTVRVDAQLEIGQTQQSVEVNAFSQLVQTE